MQQKATTKPLFFKETHSLETIQCDGNLFNLSSLSEFQHPIRSMGFGIKYVHSGTEQYTVGNNDFFVKQGNYLLLNSLKDASVTIDSQNLAKGMCININNELIASVVASLKAPDTPFSDPALADFFYTNQFLENQYLSHSTALGNYLNAINEQVRTRVFTSEQVNHELFYNLAERLVMDQTSVFKQLQNIPTVKAETKRELFRRIQQGKAFIDAHFTESLTIDRIAREAGMSEFHFFRLFKQTIGVSPYQYLLSIRLKKALVLLKADYSVSDVAHSIGFADLQSFSKAFKKHYGCAPSQFV